MIDLHSVIAYYQFLQKEFLFKKEKIFLNLKHSLEPENKIIDPPSAKAYDQFLQNKFLFKKWKIFLILKH
jgi:hypothetical protein